MSKPNQIPTYAELAEMVVTLREENVQLKARIKELEARLGKDSHNSSKPPSSDNPYTKAKAQSQREQTGRKPGGQPRREGVTLEQTSNPDQIENHCPTGHCSCGRSLNELEEVSTERRQSIEIEIKKTVVEHVVTKGVCRCGRHHQGDFPDWVKAPVQYGPSVKGLATYMTEYQLIPYARTSEFFKDIADIAISVGTLEKNNRTGARQLKPVVTAIRHALIQSPVAHADESGMRVNDALHWLHVLSTDTLTSYWIHPKRGREALDEFGLLELFEGTLVHDHWSAYAVYDCLHAFCNSHHLRELIGIKETTKQAWADKLMTLLLEGKKEAEQTRENGLQALPAERITDYQNSYDAIISEGELENPRNTAPTGKRGRIKQTPAYNLLARLRKHRDDTLRYLTDLTIPFDNNLAERDVRMPKCKQKISGCFRSDEGAETFATIRSYLSTLRKQSENILEALIDTFSGNPRMPELYVSET